ncbi:hypothetical protein BGZ61DRAFT_531750 [Ilyonectria robusta]|uniref:uncharacterized protein n=1 Tax=Ilyonectria robusta TaxID=1079257 RepID=UPI001E8CF863|nr:uncharacterized protein BGZ61DRAFT_531750 [Ilyonectria robusta]KAH8706584.1 hypothetical protein BGZ61DRAFT_531750 [Ilyonectria robusta]
MAKLGRVLGRSHYSLCDLFAPDYGQTIIASLTRPRVVRLESLDQVKPRFAAQVGCALATREPGSSLVGKPYYTVVGGHGLDPFPQVRSGTGLITDYGLDDEFGSIGLASCLSAGAEGFAAGNTAGISQDDLVNLQQLTASATSGTGFVHSCEPVIPKGDDEAHGEKDFSSLVDPWASVRTIATGKDSQLRLQSWQTGFHPGLTDGQHPQTTDY